MARAMLRIDVHDQLPLYRRSNRPKGNKLISNQVIVYPNPTSTEITIFSNQPFLNAELKIFNSTGMLVHQIFLSDFQTLQTISLIQLPPGIYSYQIITSRGLIKADKLVLIK